MKKRIGGKKGKKTQETETKRENREKDMKKNTKKDTKKPEEFLSFFFFKNSHTRNQFSLTSTGLKTKEEADRERVERVWNTEQRNKRKTSRNRETGRK